MVEGPQCVPQDREIRDSILREAHDTRHSIHPGCTKMYKDLKVESASWPLIILVIMTSTICGI
jgi:hypothetical protein